MTRFTAELDATLPRLAIDLGYSAQSASCGFVHSGSVASADYQFGACIDATIEQLTQAGRHILILEAVLSTYHRPDGNPNIRGNFEKGRGWYHGPGVSTYAGALRFLSELDRRLPNTLRPIPIVEGFLSYKKRPTQHHDDAQRMINEFDTAERFEPHAHSEPILPCIDRAPLVLRYNQP